MSQDSLPETSSDNERSLVVMLSGDLMFGSRVKSAAQNAGLECRIGSKLPVDRGEEIRFVIVDLSTKSGSVGDIAAECAERCPQAILIAYGPHVQVAKLEAAHQAGIKNVMTNGQFNNRLPTLFAD